MIDKEVKEATDNVAENAATENVAENMPEWMRDLTPFTLEVTMPLKELDFRP